MATSLSTSGLPSNTLFLGPSKPITQTASRWFQPFLHSSSQCVPTLYNGMSLSRLKIAPSHEGPGPPSNTLFHGSTQVHHPNGILIGSDVLQGSLVWQTDRPTDHGTWSVTTGCIYVRSTAMWPNNKKFHQSHTNQQFMNLPLIVAVNAPVGNMFQRNLERFNTSNSVIKPAMHSKQYTQDIDDTLQHVNAHIHKHTG